MSADVLARLPLGARAIVGGLLVERVSLFGFRVDHGGDVLDQAKALASLENFGGGVAPTVPPRDETLAGVTAPSTSADPSPSSVPTHAEEGAADGERRARETLEPGPAAEARIAELRKLHGTRAVRVTGRARAKRARWLPGAQDVVLTVSYPERIDR